MTNVLIGILIGLGAGSLIVFALYYSFAKKVRW